MKYLVKVMNRAMAAVIISGAGLGAQEIEIEDKKNPLRNSRNYKTSLMSKRSASTAPTYGTLTEKTVSKNYKMKNNKKKVEVVSFEETPMRNRNYKMPR
ncbi:MAG: hypothetical protein NXI00_04560 [Cytophagales bacterium]|nr:hypothetical protein [Cytophagales bacterium]